MKRYLESEGVKADWDVVNVVDVYRDYHGRKRSKMERELADSQAELKTLVENMNRLPSGAGEAIGIQRDMIEEQNRKVKELKDKLTPLDVRLESIFDDLGTLDKSLAEAEAALPGDDARRKVLSLRKVVREIRLRFVHYTHKPTDRRTKAESLKRSSLREIGFFPVIGDPVEYTVSERCFANDIRPGPG